MPTFIKAGFWKKTRKALEGELNLDNLISSLIPVTPPTPPSYKVYSAKITGQIGSALPPTVTVFENTLGHELTFLASFIPGDNGYTINCSSPIFLEGKTWTNPPDSRISDNIRLSRLNDNQIFLICTSGGFSLSNTSFEIRVYN